MHMKKFFQHNSLIKILIVAFFVLIPIPVLYHWFNHGSIIYFWDTTVPLNPAKNLHDFYYLWKDSIFPGSSDPAWSWLPYIFLFYLFNFITKSLSASQAILYWILMSSSLISFYCLIKTLLKEMVIDHKYLTEVIAALGAVLYTFNLYVFYYSFRIFNPQEFIIAFFPLNFLALIKLYNLHGNDLDTKKSTILWIFLFFASLFAMVPGFSNLIFFLEYYLLIVFYLVFYLFIKRKFTLRFFANIALFLTAIFFFNFWWLFPMILGLKDTFGATSVIGTNIYFILNSELSTLINSIRIMGMPPMISPIFTWENYYINNSWFTLPLFIFPLFILLLAKSIRETKIKNLLTFIFIVFLCSLFVVKEANPPFSFIMQFAFDRIPFFGVFRDAYHKAGLFYIFAYFVIFSVSLRLIYKKISSIKRKNFFLILMSIVVIIGTIIMIAPFYIFNNIPKLIDNSGNFSIEFSAKTKVPQEYFDLKPVIESNCKNETVMVIPKTSILTSAYWGKGNSYIGQDMLHYLINCNFLTTQTSQNKPDSFTSAPYLMLQNNDFSSFKNYLIQNNITLILVRKDYINNAYTDLIPLSLNTVMRYILSDSDFGKMYENDSLILYKLKTNSDNNYGFQNPSTILYTNSSLSSADDFRILSNESGMKNPLYISGLDTYKKYGKYVNEYVTKANCIGCININVSEFEIQNNGFMERIKTIIKLVIGRKTEFSQEQEISQEIVKLNNKYALLFDSLKNIKIKSIKESMSEYLLQLNHTFGLLEEFKSDTFSVNNKKIEMQLYLDSQNGKLLDLFERTSGSINQAMAKLNLRAEFLKIVSRQEVILNSLNKDTYRTDYKNNLYRMRLDVPVSGEYSCLASAYYNKDISINSVLINEKPLDFKNLNPVYFIKGSYRIELGYSNRKIFNSANTFASSENVSSFKLDKISNGSYLIDLTFNPNYNKQPFTMLISKGTLSEKTLQSIRSHDSSSKKNKNIIFRDDIILNDNLIKKEYKSSFEISRDDNTQDYYLYFIPTDFVKQNSRIYSSLNIERATGSDDLSFYCSMSFPKDNLLENNPLFVKEINKTLYKVTLPKDFVSGFITFNQSFNKDWQAYSVIDGQKHVFDHIANGYSNAWFIDTNKSKEITVVFTRQNLSEKVALVSFVLVVISVILYLYIRFKKSS